MWHILLYYMLLCVKKPSPSCQFPFCASPILHFEIKTNLLTSLLTFCAQ